MDSDNPEEWIKEPAENYLPEHFLFRAVPEVLWKYWKNKDTISPHIFTTDQCKGGLSTDWSKYTTPEETYTKRTIFNENTGVIQFMIGEFNKIIQENKFKLEIEHDPIRKPTKEYPFINRGHTLINGIKGKAYKTVIQLELTEICSWTVCCKPKKIRDS